jgi:Tol biopolymer transport system component
VNVDRRTDIWAFGVILFEMLTGAKLFQGDTISDTLAAVLRKEPDWDALPVEEAPELCRLIERCLERNPKQRLRDIGEARIFLQDGGASGTNLSFSQLGMTAPTSEPVKSGPPIWLTAALLVVGLVAGTFLGMKFLAPSPEMPVIHAMFPPPPNTQYQLTGTGPGPAVLSPDGTMLAFTVLDENAETTLYLRHLDKGESTPISGTRGAVYPFWSPESKFIAFFVNGDGKLKKVAVAGGPPVSLCNAENGKGGSWNEAGDIIFAARAGSGISRVPAVGGEPVPVTRLDGTHNSHRHPRFLPGGQEFILVARPASSTQANDIILASLDTNVTPRVVAQSQTHAEYVDGHLLAVREDVLMAIPFTPDMERVIEGGTPLVENVLSIMGAAVGVFSASRDGMLIFQTGASNNQGRQIYWTNRDGGGSEVIGDRGELFHPAVSPDGTRAVIEVHGESTEGVDLWILDLATGLRTRFTFAPGDENRPVWTPDGQKIIYRTARDSVFAIMEQPVEGQGGAAILLESKLDLAPFDVSPDGTTLILDFQREDTVSELRTLDLQGGDGQPVVLANHPENSLGGGVYSPDGRWIAYHTETAAAWDVFVMPASGGTRKWQVTSSGTAYPEWNEDGTELWVSSFNGTLLAYKVDGSGETFRVGGFTEMAVVTGPDGTGNHYDLHPDGERLVQAGPDPDFQRLVSHLHLVTDWKRGLMR